MSASVEVISSYVPMLVRDRLARESSAFADQEIFRTEGAILFADISGFTILTERLAVKGAIGAEELTSALNAYFDRLIERIAEHGGDVLKMAGDALIALWPVVDGETLAEATLRASQCGLAVGRTLQHYEVAEGIKLTSKVGIGAGEMIALFVGGLYERWELLLAGSPLVQMGLAEHHAQPGEVVLSPEAWALVGRDCVGEPAGDGLFRLRQARAIPTRSTTMLPSTIGIDSRLRSFLPAAIRTRLDAGQTDWLGELRRLTVLFVNLPPTDTDRPDALERARAIIFEVQAGLYHHEGSLNKLSVDEKGTTAVAAMGLPPLAHRDDARRAVQAALRIFDRLATIGVRCSIGVATGRVYCGEIGNARRREYTIIGRVVNLAARLMQAAQQEHGILCDEETAKANRSCFRFEALPPRTLKNIEGPVAIFRPIAEIPACGERREIIGRLAERNTLLARLDSLQDGRGGVVVIEGEPGIGKSQLIADLVAGARSRGLASHVGSSEAIERLSPYHAWRPVFASLFGDIDEHEWIHRAQEWLGDNAELAPLLNVVLPLDLSETDRTADIVGQARADTTNDLLIGLLRRASTGRPTVLVIDDAHWMDSASWALTLRLARNPGEVLLIVASRPKTTVLPEQHQALLQVAGDILRLSRLSTDEAVALACLRLGVDSLPLAAEELILQKAQGSPLYCEELAYALRDSGLLVIESGHCRIKPGVDLSGVGIPDSIEGLINDRVDRLAPSQQMALKVASVIGRLFGLRLLQDVYPIEPERREVPVHLDSLSRMELIQPDEPEPDLTYIFRHVITRDVVYDLLPFAQRRRLHHDVAGWYERSPEGEPATSYALLAHHWSMAGDDPRAIGYLEKAGEQALKGGAYQEAVDFLKRAVTLQERAGSSTASDPLRVARWEYQLGEAHLSLGHLVQSLEHTRRSLSLLDRPIPSRLRLPLGYLTQLTLQTARRIGPGNGSRTASTALRLASSAYGLVGQLSYFDQNLAIGVYSALRSLNLAESGGHSPELARALSVMCVACGMVPVHSMAELYRKRAFEVVGRLDDVRSRAWVLQLTGMYDLGIGRWDRAQESLAEAVAINKRLGDWRRWEESSGELGRLKIDLGDYDAAASTFREFGEEARRRGHDQSIAWGYHGRSRALIRQGRFDDAAALLEQSLALPGEALGIGDAILRGGLLAQIHVGRRDWAAAREVADAASALIRKSPPMVSYSQEGYAGVAEAYLALWETGAGEDTRKSASSAITRLSRMATLYPVGQARAMLCRAKAHHLLGRPRRARRAWSRALKVAERLQMPYEQALAHLEFGRSLEPGDPERTRRISQAQAIFRRIGAVPLSGSFEFL